MILTIYRPRHWSYNTQNSAFAVQVIVWGFPVVMLIVRRVPFRVGLGILGYGVAFKPVEGDGFLVEWA